MALIEQQVTVTTKYGRCPAFAACPDAPGAFPGIIFYMDAPGFREELCNMARRIAKHGYCFAERMVYHPVAAEHSWAKVPDLWDRNLKQA